MRTKIITFGCIMLAGMMIGSGVKTVKAEETAVTDSAIETMVDEVKSEKAEILPEEKSDEEVRAEEIEVEEDETPLGSAKEKRHKQKEDTTKKSSNKTVKKAGKIEKVKKTEKQSKDVIKYTDEEFRILV